MDGFMEASCLQCGSPQRPTAAGILCPVCLLRLGASGSSETTPPSRWISEEREGGAAIRFRLLELLGEGGFGAVWLAEQTEPVRREVALKISKTTLDTPQQVARFQAERQALALMNHPNIARMLEGGTTKDGRLFFAMELARGLPMDAYCDRHRLTVRKRLELFILLCDAVQHAHQKALIHRDLKPANILVMEVDGRPVPKVIDFGIAKAIGQELSPRALSTSLWQVVGTLAYMSPEQASLGRVDADTRSDIYSLGVLLGELLAGKSRRTLGEKDPESAEDLLAQVRNRESTPPSVCLDRLKEPERTEVARVRGTNPDSLRRLLRGELDWITAKCLEQDRERRYQSASALAADLQNHLHGEPVLAGPPTARYRLGKLMRKHRGALAGMAVLFGVILAGLIVVTVLLARERAARTRSEQEVQLRIENGKILMAMIQHFDAGFMMDVREFAGMTNAAQVKLVSQQVTEGIKRAENGEWAQSLELLERTRLPGFFVGLYRNAPLFLGTGDTQGYLKLRVELLAAIEQAEALTVLEQVESLIMVERLVKAALLHPLGPDQAEQVGKVSDALALNPTLEEWVRPWVLANKALADCRRGRLESALAGLDQIRSGDAPPAECRRLAESIRSLVEAMLGQTEASRASRAKATAFMTSGDARIWGAEWHDRLISYLITEEARRLAP